MNNINKYLKTAILSFCAITAFVNTNVYGTIPLRLIYLSSKKHGKKHTIKQTNEIQENVDQQQTEIRREQEQSTTNSPSQTPTLDVNELSVDKNDKSEEDMQRLFQTLIGTNEKKIKQALFVAIKEANKYHENDTQKWWDFFFGSMESNYFNKLVTEENKTDELNKVIENQDTIKKYEPKKIPDILSEDLTIDDIDQDIRRNMTMIPVAGQWTTTWSDKNRDILKYIYQKHKQLKPQQIADILNIHVQAKNLGGQPLTDCNIGLIRSKRKSWLSDDTGIILDDSIKKQLDEQIQEHINEQKKKEQEEERKRNEIPVPTAAQWESKWSDKNRNILKYIWREYGKLTDSQIADILNIHLGGQHLTNDNISLIRTNQKSWLSDDTGIILDDSIKKQLDEQIKKYIEKQETKKQEEERKRNEIPVPTATQWESKWSDKNRNILKYIYQKHKQLKPKQIADILNIHLGGQPLTGRDISLILIRSKQKSWLSDDTDIDTILDDSIKKQLDKQIQEYIEKQETKKQEEEQKRNEIRNEIPVPTATQWESTWSDKNRNILKYICQNYKELKPQQIADILNIHFQAKNLGGKPLTVNNIDVIRYKHQSWLSDDTDIDTILDDSIKKQLDQQIQEYINPTSTQSRSTNNDINSLNIPDLPALLLPPLHQTHFAQLPLLQPNKTQMHEPQNDLFLSQNHNIFNAVDGTLRSNDHHLTDTQYTCNQLHTYTPQPQYNYPLQISAPQQQYQYPQPTSTLQYIYLNDYDNYIDDDNLNAELEQSSVFIPDFDISVIPSFDQSYVM